jgi:hypothetical protein
MDPGRILDGQRMLEYQGRGGVRDRLILRHGTYICIIGLSGIALDSFEFISVNTSSCRLVVGNFVNTHS